MLAITIDSGRCVQCGDCEGWLPGIMAAATPGPWLVSICAPHADITAIERAVLSCPLKLITMEEHRCPG